MTLDDTQTAPLAEGVAWDAEGPYHVEVDVNRYLDQAVLEREFERVWPKIWQVACSTDHVARPGDYFEYRAGPYSVLIVRGDDGELRAFQNVCRHRGNLLCQGAGEGITELRCGFHNWSWNLQGQLSEVPSRRGFGALRNDDLPLLAAQVDTWGPLVFINLDLQAEPLLQWMEGIPDDVAWLGVDDFHCGVTTTTPVSCNWKVVSEGFSESYHVQGLHREMLNSVDEVNAPQFFWDRQAVSYQTYGVPSPRLRDVADQEIWDSFCTTQGARLGLPVDQTTPMPELADDETVHHALAEAIRADAARRDVDLHQFTDQQIMGLRQYNLFPNACLLISADSFNVLVSRPSTTVGQAELYTLHFTRLPPGATARRPAAVENDLNAERLGLVFNQDIRVMSAVQRGMAQPGLQKVVVSSEERRILNTHRVMAGYMDDPAPS